MNQSFDGLLLKSRSSNCDLQRIPEFVEVALPISKVYAEELSFLIAPIRSVFPNRQTLNFGAFSKVNLPFYSFTSTPVCVRLLGIDSSVWTGRAPPSVTAGVEKNHDSDTYRAAEQMGNEKVIRADTITEYREK